MLFYKRPFHVAFELLHDLLQLFYHALDLLLEIGMLPCPKG
jgi:hypothetical protein